MPYWGRLLQADIFPQKLSRRSAMAILEAVSGVACTNTGTFEAREAQRIGDGALVAEIRERDDYAVNAVAIGAEMGGAAQRFFVGFDRAVIAFFFVEDDYVHARLLQHLEHFGAADFGEMAREEAAVSHDQGQRDFLVFHCDRGSGEFFSARWNSALNF